MSRVFSPKNIVQTPMGTIIQAYAMTSEAVLTAYELIKALAEKEQTFPQFLRPSLDRLEKSVNDLGLILQPSGDDAPMTRKEADILVDNAWRAMHDFLLGWAKVDPKFNAHAAGAQSTFNLVFSDGKGFIAADYQTQWVESETRLEALSKEPYLTTIINLGGEGIFEALVDAHAAFGRAMGITVQPEASQSAFEASRVMREHLRVYILKAAAWAEPTVPGSEELSRALLEPLETWERQSSSTSSKTSTTTVDSAEVPEESEPPVE